MLIADADHDNKIVENVLSLQRQCRTGLAELEAELESADSVGGDTGAAAAIWAERLVDVERENRRLLDQLDSVHLLVQAQEVLACCVRSSVCAQVCARMYVSM
jgi:hypothetical protein